MRARVLAHHLEDFGRGVTFAAARVEDPGVVVLARLVEHGVQEADEVGAVNVVAQSGGGRVEQSRGTVVGELGREVGGEGWGQAFEVLTGPVYVEEAHDDDVHAVVGAVCLAQLFGGVFGHGVGEVGRHGVVFAECASDLVHGRRFVDGGRRGKDDALHLGEPRRLEDVAGTGDIDVVGQARVALTNGQGGHGGEVGYRVHTLHESGQFGEGGADVFDDEATECLAGNDEIISLNPLLLRCLSS